MHHIFLILFAASCACITRASTPCSTSEVRCQTCVSGADVNAMATLPRINRKGQALTSNLNDFTLFSCYGDSNGPAFPNQTCKFISTTDLAAEVFSGAKDSRSVVSYLESILFYVGFGVACGLCCIVFSSCFCFCRCCCCCITGGVCGKRFPTYTTRRCRLGFREVATSLLSSSDARVELGYPTRARLASRLFIISYIIIVVCFILVGQYSGNLSFTKSFHAMASSPAGFMTTVRGLDVPLSNLAASLVSGVIAPFMSGIRSTLLASVSLDDLAVDAQCVVSGLASSLPDATVLVGFLDNVNSSLTSLSSDANALQSNISQIDASLSRSVALTTSLSSNLTVLSNTSAAFNGTLGVLTPLLAVLAANITTFLSPVTGLPVAHAAANNTIRYLPWQSNAIALVSSSPSMNALLAGTYDGNGGTNNRLALRASLAAFQANISRVPNLAATASLLSNVTSFVVTFRSSGLLDAVDVSLGSSDIALASVPSAATLAVVLNSVQEFLDSLSLVGLRTAIHSFNDTLTTLPTTVPIRAELDKIVNLRAVIDCLSNMVDAVHSINASFAQLPGVFSSVDSVLSTANNSYAPAQAQLSSFNSTLDQYDNVSTLAPNFTAIDVQISTMSSNINSPPVNLSSINNTLWTAQGTRSAVNVSSLRISLIAFNTSLWNSDIVTPPSVISSLTTLSPSIVTLNAQLVAALTALDTFSNTLRCSGTTAVCTTIGSVAPPCNVANPCTAATRFCMVDGTTPCSRNSDCASSTCPFDSPTLTAATNALQGYGTASPGTDDVVSSLTPVVTAMGSAVASLNTIPSVAAFSDKLSAVQSSLAAIPITSNLASVSTLQAQLDPNVLDLDTTQSSINSSKATFSSASSSLASVRSQLVSFNGSLSGIKSQASSLGDKVTSFCDALSKYFNDTLPRNLIAMNVTNIARAKASRGITGILFVIADVIDDAVAALTAATNASFAVDTDAIVTTVASIADVLHNDSYAAHGPLYFFGSLARLSMVSPSEAAGGGGLFVSASGAKWSGNRICLVDTCVSSTVLALNQGPLSASAITGSSGGASIPLSREQLMFLPYLIPIILVLLASFAALGFWGKTWQCYPACCSAIGICIVLPWIFIFSGALFFPFVMVVADGCRGLPNVGHHYIQGSENALCTMIGSSVNASYRPGTCTLHPTSDSAIDLHLADIFAAVMGSCSSHPTALSGLFAQTAALLASLPASTVNATLNQISGTGDTTGAYAVSSMGIIPRPPLRHVLSTAGVGLSATLSNFIDDLSGVLTCDALSGDINAVMGSFCCDFMTAFFWYVSSWYFIAFAMCGCGFASSVLGSKRLPNELWGSDYEARTGTSTTTQVVNDFVDKRDFDGSDPTIRSDDVAVTPGGRSTLVPPSYIANPVGLPPGRPAPRRLSVGLADAATDPDAPRRASTHVATVHPYPLPSAPSYPPAFYSAQLDGQNAQGESGESSARMEGSSRHVGGWKESPLAPLRRVRLAANGALV